MELSAPTQLGLFSNADAKSPDSKVPEVTRVNPMDDSAKSRNDPKQTSQNADNAALARSHSAAQMVKPDENPPAGPPPSFDISLLEVKQDLKKEIARMEAARGQDQNAQGIAVSPTDTAESTGTDARSDKPVLSPETDSTKPDQAVENEPAPVIKTSMGIVYAAESGPV